MSSKNGTRRKKCLKYKTETIFRVYSPGIRIEFDVVKRYSYSISHIYQWYINETQRAQMLLLHVFYWHNWATNFINRSVGCIWNNFVGSSLSNSLNSILLLFSLNIRYCCFLFVFVNELHNNKDRLQTPNTNVHFFPLNIKSLSKLGHIVYEIYVHNSMLLFE